METKNSLTSKVEYVKKEFRPFANFDTAIAKSPDWYRAYNQVKHNREDNLEKANLENCMNAVAGILVLLYSQFGSKCIETYGSCGVSFIDFDEDYDDPFDADVIFEINPPQIIDWNEIKSSPEPFEKFTF